MAAKCLREINQIVPSKIMLSQLALILIRKRVEITTIKAMAITMSSKMVKIMTAQTAKQMHTLFKTLTVETVDPITKVTVTVIVTDTAIETEAATAMVTVIKVVTIQVIAMVTEAIMVMAIVMATETVTVTDSTTVTNKSIRIRIIAHYVE
jgi:hypothetical protein